MNQLKILTQRIFSFSFSLFIINITQCDKLNLNIDIVKIIILGNIGVLLLLAYCD